ncbi:MAG TPA: phosphatase PAP2 family protein [Planctomycetota bacterium]|nr:phosphatase PAP2 family protein [Planctomycetota bacterium]
MVGSCTLVLVLTLGQMGPPDFQDPEPGKGWLGDLGDKALTVGKDFGLDTAYIATAPLRWNGTDYLNLGAGLAILGGVMVFDDEINGFFRRHETVRSQRFASYADDMAESKVPFILGGGLTAAGLALGDAKLQRTGLEVMENVILVEGLTTAGKRAFGRSRPFTGKDSQHWSFFGGRDDAMRSFPSGHGSLAFGIAVIVAEEYPDTLWPYVSYGLASTVGWARMQLGAHWASDVTASALLSLAVGKTLVWLHAQAEYPPLVPWLTQEDGHPVVGGQVGFSF